MPPRKQGHKRPKPLPVPPPETVLCCLCKGRVDFRRQDPAPFFKHLRDAHGCFYNLLALLELSLSQPQLQTPNDEFHPGHDDDTDDSDGPEVVDERPAQPATDCLEFLKF